MGKLTKGQQTGICLRHNKLRGYWPYRSKYLPHQGKRECERRANPYPMVVPGDYARPMPFGWRP